MSDRLTKAGRDDLRQLCETMADEDYPWSDWADVVFCVLDECDALEADLDEAREDRDTAYQAVLDCEDHADRLAEAIGWSAPTGTDLLRTLGSEAHVGAVVAAAVLHVARLAAEREAALARAEKAERERDEAQLALDEIAEIAELVGPGGDDTPFGRVESLLSALHDGGDYRDGYEDGYPEGHRDGWECCRRGDDIPDGLTVEVDALGFRVPARTYREERDEALARAERAEAERDEARNESLVSARREAGLARDLFEARRFAAWVVREASPLPERCPWEVTEEDDDE